MREATGDSADADDVNLVLSIIDVQKNNESSVSSNAGPNQKSDLLVVETEPQVIEYSDPLVVEEVEAAGGGGGGKAGRKSAFASASDAQDFEDPLGKNRA